MHQPIDGVPPPSGGGPGTVQEIHLTPADPEGVGEEVHTTSKCWCQPIQANFNLGLLKGTDRVFFHREYSEVLTRTDEPTEEPTE